MRHVYFSVVILMAALENCEIESKTSKRLYGVVWLQDMESLFMDDHNKSILIINPEAMTKSFLLDATRQHKSMVCSPLTALISLSKLEFGAEGDLLDEMERLLEPKAELPWEVKLTLYEMAQLKGVALTVASQIYLQQNLTQRQEFKELIEYIYQSDAATMDTNNPYSVSTVVNTWINQQTVGVIPEILGPYEITSDMNLILVSAVHFKGEWETKFTREYPDIFHSAGRDETLTMMEVTGEFMYTDDLIYGSKVIILPYKGGDAVFLMILPETADALQLLLLTLTFNDDRHFLSLVLQKTKMILSMPKFTVDSVIDLGVLYKMAGLHDMFSSGFTGMVHDTAVKLDLAKQRAVMEVTTEGAFMDETMKRQDEHIHVNANHPFVYFVITKRQILMAGVFTGS